MQPEIPNRFVVQHSPVHAGRDRGDKGVLGIGLLVSIYLVGGCRQRGAFYSTLHSPLLMIKTLTWARRPMLLTTPVLTSPRPHSTTRTTSPKIQTLVGRIWSAITRASCTETATKLRNRFIINPYLSKVANLRAVSPPRPHCLAGTLSLAPRASRAFSRARTSSFHTAFNS